MVGCSPATTSQVGGDMVGILALPLTLDPALSEQHTPGYLAFRMPTCFIERLIIITQILLKPLQSSLPPA